MMHIPMVLEGRPGHERAWDLYSRLNKDRIIILGDKIDDNVANIIVAQLLFLESEDRTSDIYMYINSPGGSISSGMAIYDTMRYVSPDVRTICVGSSASMGAILLSAGTKGKRYILPNAEVMIHQPLGGVQGQASDIEINAKRIVKLKNKLAKMLADNCGKSVKQVLKDIDRDYWLDAEDAIKYGIVDEIMTREGKDEETKDSKMDLL